MAATGKTPILLYGSTTATNVPVAGNLTNSSDGCEIAINVADKNLFFKDSTNAVNTVPIRQSSGSSDGWLSSTNWTTFNSKQAAYTNLTSIGSLSNATGWLYNNGSGTFSYSTPSASDVGAVPTSRTVSTTSPLAGGGALSSNLTLSITQATTSTSGYLSSTDWNTFNNKQPAGTYVTSVTGTAPVVSSGGTTPAISMAAASGSVNGYLTSTDWTTFNSKAPAFTYTSNYIPYGQGTTTPTQSSGLTYDGTTFSTTGIATLKNTSAFVWNAGLASTAATVIGVAGTGGSCLINTPSINTSFSSGLGIDGSYATQTSTVNIRAVGVNSAGGYGSTLNFYTSSNTSQVLAASIDKNQNVTVSAGNLVIGTSGKGVDFSATAGTGTSELLADYEEGTWTPTLTGGTTNPTVTYGAATLGRYTKVGNLVSIKCRIDVSTYSGGSGALQIAGIPYAPKASSGQYPMTTFTSGVSWGAGETQVMAWAQQGLSVMFMWGTQNNGASYDVVVGDVSAGDIIMVNGTYLTD